jgi:opacity protein-like surface antigen
MNTTGKIAGAAALYTFLLSAPAPGQTQELSILAGAANPSAQVGIGPAVTVSGGTSVAIQVDYVFRLRKYHSGSLYLELPLSRVARVAAGIRQSGVDTSQSKFFFTPGLRYSFMTRARVSPYLAGGFGLGWFDRVNVSASPLNWSVHVSEGAKAAFGFGGGAQIRISRNLAFRAELRDFVPAGADSGPRNHLVYQGGFGITF